MSVESKKHLNNGKPITPRAPIRSKSGPYLAPKLANTARTSPSPEIRRDGRVAGTEVNAKVVSLTDITTPVKSFLATNVTPRSSSRRSRAASGSSTPNSTPGVTPMSSRQGSKVIPTEDLQGLGIKSEPRSIITEDMISNGTSPLMIRNLQALETQEPDRNGPDSFKFFHASDASLVSKKTSLPPTRVGAGFVYADGRQEVPIASAGSHVGSKPASQVGTQHKFYHANGQSGTSPRLSPSPTNISPVASPKLSHPMLASNHNAPRHRSTSPLKEFEVPGQYSANKARRTSGTSAVSYRSTTKSTVSALPARSPQTSSNSENRMHVKTQSMSSLDAHTRPQRAISQQDSTLFALQSPQSTQEGISFPSFLNIKTAQMGPSSSTPASPLISPDRATSSGGGSKLDQLNSMAANARRERKVLDLEISNSSLLAINRTLEREMRKQKIELRRFRRLTSGGRLSFAPTDRSVSGTTTISTLSLDSDLNFDSDEEDTLTDIPSEDEDSEDSDVSMPPLSPEAQAARDLRQRSRDEKRLQLDLSKHQQLLIDSQKMNESLKKCLGWTEELILEGKKALDYQVRYHEIAMGGRVLHEDDNPEMQDAQPRHGLLSPTNVSVPGDVLWASGASPTATVIYQRDDSSTSIMADEGKEFREYLDGLMESQ